MESCVDDNAGLASESDNALPSCADHANFCEDESMVIAMGSPAGWFSSKCPSTCGTCSTGKCLCIEAMECLSLV